MTIENKLEKIKKLADNMYYAAANLGSNVGSGERLRKTMEEYHKFIIHEYHKEEPVSEDFDMWYEKEWIPFSHSSYTEKDILEEAYKAGANWQKQQMMKDAIDVKPKGVLEKVYQPWLTPDQARRAVEIAREETYNKIWNWLAKHINDYIVEGNGRDIDLMFDDIKQAIKDE